MKSDDPIRNLLKTWNPSLAPAPRFRAEVWAQIEARRTSGWRAWLPNLSELARRPASVAALLALSAVVGLGAAQFQADRIRLAEREARLQQYVTSIDPLLRTGHQHFNP